MRTQRIGIALLLLTTFTASAEEPAALAKASGCFECHSVEKKVTGPAYRDVAARYAGKKDETREWLIEKVKHGGKGNWTAITRGKPMPAHSARLTDEQIASLVNWILNLEPAKP